MRKSPHSAFRAFKYTWARIPYYAPDPTPPDSVAQYIAQRYDLTGPALLEFLAKVEAYLGRQEEELRRKARRNPAGRRSAGHRRRGASRNADDVESERLRRLTTSWTGSKAQYVSPPGPRPAGYGAIPHSELAMHTRFAGRPAVRFALFTEPDGRDPSVRWAHVQDDRGHVLDGLPGEVLPDEVRRKLGGFGHERLPDT